MLKRVTWWMAGAVMGSAGSAWVQRRVKRAVRHKVAGIGPTAVVDLVKKAVNEGRDAARTKEQELKARIRR